MSHFVIFSSTSSLPCHTFHLRKQQMKLIMFTPDSFFDFSVKLNSIRLFLMIFRKKNHHAMSSWERGVIHSKKFRTYLWKIGVKIKKRHKNRKKNRKNKKIKKSKKKIEKSKRIEKSRTKNRKKIEKQISYTISEVNHLSWATQLQNFTFRN